MSGSAEKTLQSLYERQINRFKDRLKEAIGDESVRSFSKRCGISESVIRKYLAGSHPVLDKLPKIAEATNKSMEWLVSGAQSVEQQEKQFHDDFVLIPGYSIQVSAGSGVLNIDQMKPSRHLAFRRKWLNYRGFAQRDLVIFWAKGDSMEPTIYSNNTLVVHTGKTCPKDGHIYIFRNNDELFVKRYQSVLGAWRLISDNPIYESVDIRKEEQHQFQVIGQVVHIAKDIGD
ncbi:LexA family transcriptional regulator [Marinomonas agarivorans]|nr:LexA family transcriptional regulator [Marinomonas agarivorans]